MTWGQRAHPQHLRREGGAMKRLAITLAILAIVSGTIRWSISPGSSANDLARIPPVDSKVLAALEADGSADFFVVFSEQADLRAADSIADWEERGRFVYDALEETTSRSQADAVSYLESRGQQFSQFAINNSLLVVGGTSQILDSLLSFPRIDRVRASRSFPVPQPVESSSLGSTTAFVQPNIEQIRAPLVWQAGHTGQDIVVANIDTGVQWDHPALILRYRGWTGSAADHNYNWWSAFDSPEPIDDVGHGTHVMGTAVGEDLGIGAAPGARWIACDACSSSLPECEQCPETALLECGSWMLAPTRLDGSAPDPSRRPHVINFSLAASGFDDFYRPMVNAWKSSGIYPVFGAGNASGRCGSPSDPECGSIASPATYKEATAVGAVDADDNVADFSLWGPSADPTAPNDIKPELTAPGVGVVSSCPESSYCLMSGTSMAAPHVAGTVALLWSAAPDLVGNVSSTEQLLEETAAIRDDLRCSSTSHPNNVYGWGRVDAYASVSRATGPRIAVTPPGYDDIGAILTDLGYAWTQIEDIDLNSYESISQYDIIFANCSGSAYENGPSAASSLQQFVQNGGSFYASDWAYTYLRAAFPGYVTFPDTARIGSAQTVVADIVDQGLANYIDPANPPATIELNYNLGSWVVIQGISGGTEGFVRDCRTLYAGGPANSQNTRRPREYPSRMDVRQTLAYLLQPLWG
jgi:hypothetical protein